MRTQKIVLLVPAHNEAVGIVATMESVEAQTMSPDRRIVVCDNCTDATPELARARAGWEVWETVGNTGKKGGALNQAWDRLGDYLTDDDLPRHHGRGHAARLALRRERVREVPAEGPQGAQARRRVRELPGPRARQRARDPAEDGVRARREDQPLPARDRPGARRRGDDVLRPGAARGARLARAAVRAGPDRGLRALARPAGAGLRDDGAAQLPGADRPHADGEDAVGPAPALVPGRVRVAAFLRLPQGRPQRHRLARASPCGPPPRAGSSSSRSASCSTRPGT